ncbi:MAG: ABC transporter permease [Puniceicoccaceae bacterium]
MAKSERPSAVEERFYSSETYLSHPGQLFRAMAQDLAKSWELALRLTIRDFKAQYRASLAGYLWAFIPPIVASVTFLLLRKGNVVNFPDTAIPYSVFVFTGMILWQVFVEAMNSPIKLIQGGKNMLVKLNFPREALLLSAFMQSCIGLLIRVLILIPFLLLLHPPTEITVLLFPLGGLSLVLLGWTIGIFISPIGMLYHDIQRSLTLITTFWMFVTPVVFPIGGHGLVREIVRFNPVTPLLQTSRDWLTGLQTGLHLEMLIVILLTALALPVGWLFYRIFMPHIIERMGM